MKSIYKIFILLAFLNACKSGPEQKTEEGELKGNVYASEEIGWRISIPEGWNVVTTDESKELNQKGQDLIRENLQTEIDASGLKNLLGFKKNIYNSFQATSERFLPDSGVTWDDANQMVKDIIYGTYVNEGMACDTSATTTVKIDGLDFRVFTVNIYGPDSKKILTQELYSRLINGYDFGVSINYNNEEDKKTMLDALKNSKFRK